MNAEVRGYFRRNRKLLKLLIQSANFAIEKYFHETLGMKDGYNWAPLLLPSITAYEEDSYDWGDFPPDEFYFADEEWGI